MKKLFSVLLSFLHKQESYKIPAFAGMTCLFLLSACQGESSNPASSIGRAVSAVGTLGMSEYQRDEEDRKLKRAIDLCKKSGIFVGSKEFGQCINNINKKPDVVIDRR